MTSVLIADDQSVVRMGLRALVEHDPDLTVIGEAADGLTAVALAQRHRPDIVLMDVRMPGIDGISATEQIVLQPELSAVRVIVLTTYALDEYVFRALAAGASGFLLKTIEPDELRRAIGVVAGGQALLDPAVTRRVIERFGGATTPIDLSQERLMTTLTEREREVVALVAEGLNNEEIAARLFISPLTAKTHVSRSMSKVMARDRAQLVVAAYRSGLVR
jgi:DNA-binding NarL/FixJ family response regulator